MIGLVSQVYRNAWAREELVIETTENHEGLQVMEKATGKLVAYLEYAGKTLDPKP
jgi:hypothetical protein